MTRRCSHCSNNGHNTRTCPSRASGGGGGGVRLFGVRLTEGVGPMKKSASMSCLASSSTGTGGAAASGGGRSGDHRRDSGYMSDDPVHASCSSNCRSERKKGTPWTEEEHKMFLLGLKKLGKGDWRGISRTYVMSRTPTQVASHAQKYFLRQSNVSRRKRRSSLFDMLPDLPSDAAPPVGGELLAPPSQRQELNHGVPPFENRIHNQYRGSCQHCTSSAPIAAVFYPPVAPLPSHQIWYGSTHKILSPVPVPDEVANISKLQISDALVPGEDLSLSLKMFEPTSSRKSAFRASPSVSMPDLNKNTGSVIHAV
ncbi:Duplicated homeodomain-like superfamily protein [Rhynchospora pubera]|uniref:Duplicated homeodomain-like superfamily protein n=1 Tax=Rhynchospora pubera TaxID=906938 RepID=A0AAV8C416_9POAL|nr:Duplicated homeodomain-like superfamily protein [Rhynchospora pubera]